MAGTQVQQRRGKLKYDLITDPSGCPILVNHKGQAFGPDDYVPAGDVRCRAVDYVRWCAGYCLYDEKLVDKFISSAGADKMKDKFFNKLATGEMIGVEVE